MKLWPGLPTNFRWSLPNLTHFTDKWLSKMPNHFDPSKLEYAAFWAHCIVYSTMRCHSHQVFLGPSGMFFSFMNLAIVYSCHIVIALGIFVWILFYVVYRVPVTGTRPHGSRNGSCYDWLTCGMPTRLWAPSADGVTNQNGVDVKVISNLAMGFPLFWN